MVTGRSALRLNPRYPVYIVSKGRWEKRLTSDSLAEMGVPHFIVVEEQQIADYQKNLHPLATLLVLDPVFQRDYDTCDDLGDTKSKGPGAARNFAWDHALSAGARWHWVMDDNINGFYRMNRNLKVQCKSSAIFAAMEDFCERYENVTMAGPNYFMFVRRKYLERVFVLNTRIYSCNLIRNDVEFRWRGRYNEDTDLSLQILKSGMCTVLFNAFLQMKMTTQTMKGGCNTEFYSVEGTLPKSEMQAKLHPDVSRVVWKWGRWHHHVNYEVFKRNKLKLKAGVAIPDGVNNYGMRLHVTEEQE